MRGDTEVDAIAERLAPHVTGTDWQHCTGGMKAKCRWYVYVVLDAAAANPTAGSAREVPNVSPKPTGGDELATTESDLARRTLATNEQYAAAVAHFHRTIDAYETGAEALRGDRERAVNAYEDEHSQHMRAVERVGELERRLAACEAERNKLAEKVGDAAVETLDMLASLCGCPEWEYPEQVYRDVTNELGRAKVRAENAEADRDEWRRKAERAEAERDAANDRTVEALALAGKHLSRGEQAKADLARRDVTPRVPSDTGPLVEWLIGYLHKEGAATTEDITRMAREIAAHVEKAETERAALRAARRKIVDAMPLVEAVAEMIRAAHIRRKQVGPFAHVAAREIASYVERRLPTVEELYRAYDGASATWTDSDGIAAASSLIRTRLGLDAATSERKEACGRHIKGHVGFPCNLPKGHGGRCRCVQRIAPEREEPSEPEPAGTWATLPAEVRDAVDGYADARIANLSCAQSWAEAERIAAVLHRWKSERPEPEAVSVEAVSVDAIRAEIEKRCKGRDWRMSSTAVFEAAHAIVARYGSPPTVPVLALPSVEEVATILAATVGNAAGYVIKADCWLDEARAVLDLVRERQPAAFREALAEVLGWTEDNRKCVLSWLRIDGGPEGRDLADLLAAALNGAQLGAGGGA